MHKKKPSGFSNDVIIQLLISCQRQFQLVICLDILFSGLRLASFFVTFQALMWGLAQNFIFVCRQQVQIPTYLHLRSPYCIISQGPRAIRPPKVRSNYVTKVVNLIICLSISPPPIFSSRLISRLDIQGRTYSTPFLYRTLRVYQVFTQPYYLVLSAYYDFTKCFVRCVSLLIHLTTCNAAVLQS